VTYWVYICIWMLCRCCRNRYVSETISAMEQILPWRVWKCGSFLV